MQITEGYYLQKSATPTISSYIIKGERSSETNFLTAQMRKVPSLKQTEAGWKHGFVTRWRFPETVLLIGIVRDWRNWLLSMHRKPWYASKAMHQMEFSEFIRAPWDSYGIPKKHQDQEQIITDVALGDRHPVSLDMIENVLELRTLKAQNVLSFPKRAANVLIMQYEWLNADPSALSNLLSNEFGIADVPRFEQIAKRMASAEAYTRFDSVRVASPSALPEAEMPFIRERLNPDVERALGYWGDGAV